MDILKLRDMLHEAETFCLSQNFYFQMHQCPARGENVKVMMDYKLKTEQNDQIVKFGFCPDCKTLFYRNDHESSSR